MSRIDGVGNSPVRRVVGTNSGRSAGASFVTPPGLQDKVELSGMSHLLKALKTNDIRTDKVAAVRAQIEAGTYENDKKLDTAIDRLLSDLMR
jgi:anti-sigma28 factor (negative regulator of flagellin synthesis)